MADNRDNQEDKEPIFDALDTSVACLEIMTLMIKALEPNRKRMLQKAGAGFSCATEIADWLVRQGVPFRRAHELTGKAVQLAIRQGVALQALSADELVQQPSGEFVQFPATSLHPQICVTNKNTHGGTAPEQVRERLAEVHDYLNKA